MQKKLAVIGLVALLAALVSTQAFATSKSSAVKRSITLVSVKQSADHKVTATVRITGWKMLPAKVGKKPNSKTGGHWHLFVNGKYNNATANPTSGTSLKLKAGTYKISAELANNDHSELSPPVKSKTMSIKVT